MATTIKLKSGSGAPLAGDLVAAEPAFDLTNKRLYTEDSGGTVIEVGTNPSTIDINAGTIDGTVIGGASAAAGTFTTFTSTGIDDNATSTAITIDSSQNVGIGTSSLSSRLTIREDSSNVVVDALQIENIGGGNNEGSRIKFVCDNSANSEIFSQQSSNNFGSLTFGTFSVDGSTVGGQIVLSATSDGITYSPRVSLSTGGTERLRIDSSGNVGIGTTSPFSSARLQVKTGTNLNLAVQTGTTETSGMKINAFNDAGTANIPLELNGSVTLLKTGETERMRIDSSGEVFINKTNTLNNGQLEVLAQSSHQAIVAQVQTNGNSLFQGFNSSGAAVFVATGDGALTITGSLSKGSGSFKIDHPLPEKTDTHHLVHSFVEAPQADNIYRGTVDLIDGTATVNLDTAGRMSEGTFVLLNTNVQCFTTNESGWTAVKGSVSGNVLTITAQESCADTVSWMVIGERCDQHMIDTAWTDESGRVITEPLKTEVATLKGA